MHVSGTFANEEGPWFVPRARREDLRLDYSNVRSLLLEFNVLFRNHNTSLKICDPPPSIPSIRDLTRNAYTLRILTLCTKIVYWKLLKL